MAAVVVVGGTMAVGSQSTVAGRTKLLGQGVVRGLSTFVAGFQGTAWDQKADAETDAFLREVSELRSLADADSPRIEALLKTRREFLRSQFAVEMIANRLT